MRPLAPLAVLVLTAALAGPAVAQAPTDGTCDGRTPTIVGTAGDDRLTGTQEADVISGLGGDDTIAGRGGDDVLCGGLGVDAVSGGVGADDLWAGDDASVPGDGRDLLRGDRGAMISAFVRSRGRLGSIKQP